MNKKVLIGLALILVLSVIAAACSQPAQSPVPGATTAAPAPAPAAKVYKLRNQTSNLPSPADPRFGGWGYNVGIGGSPNYINDYMKKLTNGRLEIETVPSGSLVPVAELMTAVEKGTLDMSFHVFSGYWTGTIPEAAMEVGLTYSWDHQWEYWDYMHNWGGNQLLDEAYAEHNIWRRSAANGQVYGFYTNFDPSKPENFKGKKIRASGMNADVLTAMGASPSNIAAPEIYQALKLGTIDGANYAPASGGAMGLHEVSKYFLSAPSMGLVGISLFINKNSLAALPPDLQTILTTFAAPMMAEWANYMAALDPVALRQGAIKSSLKDLQWSEADSKTVRTLAVEQWKKSFASKNARTQKMYENLIAQLKDLGKL